MAVAIEVARLVAFVGVVRTRLLLNGRRAGVPVTVLIEVARHMALVWMVGAGLFGRLRGHVHSSLVETFNIRGGDLHQCRKQRAEKPR